MARLSRRLLIDLLPSGQQVAWLRAPRGKICAVPIDSWRQSFGGMALYPGYRASAREELVRKAKQAAEKVRRWGDIVEMEPMSAFDRRIVHNALKDDPSVETHSVEVADREGHRRLTLWHRDLERRRECSVTDAEQDPDAGISRVDDRNALPVFHHAPQLGRLPQLATAFGNPLGIILGPGRVDFGA